MYRVISCVFFVLFFSLKGSTQRSYSLEQCIDSALANNIPVKKVGLTAEIAEIDRRQARMNLLPDLNANINHGLNFGRSIDPFTNAYVNQKVTGANYGISSGIVLFNGFALQSRVKETSYASEASRMEWQQAKDNLVLNVILAYLLVLNNEDQMTSAARQAETSRRALERLQVLDSQGAVRPSDLSDLRGQLMNDQLSILNVKAQLESSKLALMQLINKPYDSSVNVQRLDAGDFLTSYPASAREVYQNSLNQFSAVKAIELRRISSVYGVKTARGQMYPQLSLNGGMNTTYSSVAQNPSGGKISYGSQLQNNKFSSIGIGLSIPIFNGFFARNRVKLASIALRDAELDEQNTKQQLQRDIEQAYLNMTNAYERYKVLLEQVNAYEASFRAAEVRFNAGVGTSINYLTDYLLAKDRLDRANVNLVNARYDFVLRKKILDYYNGKP